MRGPLVATVVAVLVAGSLAGSSWGEDRNIRQDAAPGAAVTVLGSRQAEGVLGRKVRSRTDENIGRIVDVVVDRSGRIRAAVIDFGGFFGIGNRKIAVDWDALDFAAETDRRDIVTLDLTRDQIKAAPEYKDRRAVIVIGSAGSLPAMP